ncbi:MAG: phosphoenolpyruvate--protein phosphotransferase [Hyphomicrobiaceae bacterium]|nr:phosphoenolpyruvate--protein phosphotransferase [Hyphomicrobiaceae bacterium]
MQSRHGEDPRSTTSGVALRAIMRRLRSIMAKPGSDQPLLDEIVRLVAGLMVAEVCSIYVRRQDGSLELFATEGLNPSAVHNTHLKRGEGLVGLIAERAEPVNLPEAQSHPAFSYRPETGEEVYHSFLGVPILRAGQVLGVLTVQNKTPKVYSDDEVEALESTAMVLAEHLVSGSVQGIGAAGEYSRSVSHCVRGQPISEGIALGHVVLHEPRVVVARLLADDPDVEMQRLTAAINDLKGTLDSLFDEGELQRAGEHRDVFEAYRMFANDRGWLRRLNEAVAAGMTAEAAVERVQNDTRARMLKQTDPYWRERLRDLDDLSDRLLRILTGRASTSATEDLPLDTILVARSMGPAELLDYDRTRLRGLVIEEGGSQSHVAIVARAIGIPAIGAARGVVERVDPGNAAIVDADSGEVHIRPSPEVANAYTDKVQYLARRQEQYRALRTKPAITRDGVRVALQINAGLQVDMAHLAESGADGIGLFRTELQFMIASTFPRLDRQTKSYRTIIDDAGGRPVVFRTLDIGGDKVLPYIKQIQEQNPALGWRAVRMSLDRPALFRTQIRALLRASGRGELRILVPMVATIAELEQARALVERERQLLHKRGLPEPASITVGAMIEVPALLYDLDRLLSVSDFISVGSNDLLQFLFAADRTNERVANRYDPLSAPALRALGSIVEHAQRKGVPVTVCGEMSGRPLEAMALIALGYRSLSMAPAAVGPVKAMIRSLDVEKAQRHLRSLLDAGKSDIRAELLRFARAGQIEL